MADKAAENYLYLAMAVLPLTKFLNPMACSLFYHPLEEILKLGKECLCN